jgi:tetratricopeptide (TPR) repeat protein
VYRNTNHADWAATEEQREKTLPAPDCKVQTAECAFLSRHLDETIRQAAPQASPAALFWATKAYNALALGAFDRLSQLPESVEIHALKAQMLHNHKQDLEAASEWREALKFAPDDINVKRQLASALFDAKDYRSAMPLIEEQLAQEPKAADLNYLMGASLYRTEQAEKALPYLETTVQGGTTNLAADAALGLTLVSLNKSAEAIPYLKKALPMDDDGSVHYSLARAYRAAGEAQLAAETMQQYQKIQKQNREINDQLAKEAEITAPTP